jgi:hypothetical protein
MRKQNGIRDLKFINRLPKKKHCPETHVAYGVIISQPIGTMDLIAAVGKSYYGKRLQ